MSKEPTRTDFPAGDFISESAVRAVFGRRRRGSQTTAEHTGEAVQAHSPEHTSSPAGGERRLRRWSVAELIARAGAPTPTTT
jgi:hypothetical protein